MSKGPFNLVVAKGVVRFKANDVVRWLYDEAAAGRKADMNDIWRARHDGKFSLAHLQEFYRLIGYSVSGYGDVFPTARSTREADTQVAAMVRNKGKRQ